MSLYTMYCDRCDERTTHDEVRFSDYPDELIIEHPRYGCEVCCRECRVGRSKYNIPEDGADFWVTASVEQGMSIHVHPDDIDDGDSLSDHLEKILVERRGELAREIADGIRAGQVEKSGFPESEDMEGFKPR